MEKIDIGKAIEGGKDIDEGVPRKIFITRYIWKIYSGIYKW